MAITLDVLRHGRAEHHHRVDRLALDGAVDPVLHGAHPVVGQRQGLAGQQARQAGQLAQPRVHRQQQRLFAKGAHRCLVLPVEGVVDERAQVHPVALRQITQQVVRTDFVALVGRIRNPVNQEQDAAHRETL